MTVTILDGGMGRELERSGAPFRQPEWSALALIESPAHVGQAHAAFARNGAEFITTNSYAVVPFHIGRERFDAEGLRLADLAGRLARQTADEFGVRVAGSLPPVLGSYRPDLFNPDEARPILEVLIEGLSPYADVWLAETQSSLAEVALVRELLHDDPRPLWLSFTLDDHDANAVQSGAARPVLRSGEPVVEAARQALALGAAALLFNCSQPEVMEAAVREARAALGDATIGIGVYANAFASEADDAAANETLHGIRADLTPPLYLGWAKRWVDAGASMVGGCCGISPEHIGELARALK
ncbi:MAG: homocysteine S-methyltransferase family protein [Rhizobium sp.]|nr:homocysteine S-methyltransferase family protein [Rhizobium sp.]